MKRKWKYTLSISFVVLIYLVLRLGWIGTIEFGYDQPPTGMIIKDFIERGTFLTSQQFSQVTHWNYLAWGPTYVFFMTPFFLVSSSPPTVSALLVIVNLITILAVMYIGWRYYSPPVGILSALLFATTPWWVIFSRMIYLPNPAVTFTTVSMVLFFLTVKYPKKIYVALTIFSWAVLIQTHPITVSFIIPSIFLLAIYFKEYTKKYLLVGFLLSLVLFVPSIKFYYQNPDQVEKLYGAPSLFTPPETSISERLGNVTEAYFNTFAGGRYEILLGYSVSDFDVQFLLAKKVVPAISLLVLISLANGVLGAYRVTGKKRVMRVALLLWGIAPYWFLATVWVTELVPRYFLAALPAQAILVSILFVDVANWINKKVSTTKFGYLILVIPVLISIYWFAFVVNYYNFLINYDYPFGKLGGEAESPYALLDASIDWVIKDSEEKGYTFIVISNNDESPTEFALWKSTDYIWKHVEKRSRIPSPTDYVGYYLIVHSDVLNRKGLAGYVKFGPFVAYEYRGL